MTKNTSSSRENRSRFAASQDLFLKNMADALPQYVFWKNTDSTYLGCNKNYASLLGLKSPEDIVGKSDADLNCKHIMTPAQHDRDDTQSNHPFTITNHEASLILPNDEIRTVIINKQPIMDFDQIIGAVSQLTDITHFKKAEHEQIQAKQDEAADQAKSAFITHISHDLRTPLSGMIGMASMLLQEVRTKEGKKAAQDIIVAGNVLLDLFNEIIQLSNLTSNSLPISKIKFSVKELLNTLTALVTPSVNEKNLKINIHYDESIPYYVTGDRTRIHRILLNLISNSIKFTSQGTIELGAKLAQKENRDIILKLSVKDTGMGISPENQRIIFTQFTRLKTTDKGHGLGLSIVKHLVAEIGGEIYVESKEGEGSTFTCIIPLNESLLNEPMHKSEHQNGQSLPVIDLALGAKLINANEQEARNMLSMLIETFPETKNDIASFYTKKDFFNLQSAVHKFHGSTCYCGVPALKAAAHNLVCSLKLKDISEIDHAYMELYNQMNQVCSEFEKMSLASTTASKIKQREISKMT